LNIAGSSDPNLFLDSSEIYDIATDTWSNSTSFPIKRVFGRSFIFQNRYLWAGGKDNSGAPSTAIYEYIIGSGWKLLPDVLPVAIAIPFMTPFNTWETNFLGGQ